MPILITKSFIHCLSFSSYEYRKNTLERVGDEYIIRSVRIPRDRAMRLIEINDLVVAVKNEYGTTYDTKDQDFMLECMKLHEQDIKIKLFKVS